jgi:hypothetical protein
MASQEEKLCTQTEKIGFLESDRSKQRQSEYSMLILQPLLEDRTGIQEGQRSISVLKLASENLLNEVNGQGRIGTRIEEP